ncbi:MAG: 2OG-Fe(II) oxygenase [Bacteroidota bacterium]
MEHVMQRSTSQSPILDLQRWKSQLPELKKAYQREDPFPHIVLENFLEEVAAKKAYQLFPQVKDEGWIHYMHVNEKKHGLNKLELLPGFIQEVIQTLNSPESVAFISELTGIPGLKADEMLEGGGLHQSQRGGFLNIHADFTVHPHKRKWRRRVNLLVYLNPNWEQHYKGELELWSRDMQRCEQKILPLFNRCVLFNTDEDSFHGLPEAIECPEGMTRKSIALYYFTEEENSPRKRATNYRARPGDGLKSIPIYLDKQLIAIYNSLKGWLGINDDFISSILRFFHRKK